MIINDGSSVLRQKDFRQHHAFGEIVPCLFTPPEYEHLIPCDGQTISGEEFQDLIDALGTNVVPNLNGRVLQGGDNVGTYVAAGLPDIGGTLAYNRSYAGTPFSGDGFGGCFYPFQSSNALQYYTSGRSTGSGWYDIGFKASRSNPIYGKSSTVQPPAYIVKFYICYKY